MLSYNRSVRFQPKAVQILIYSKSDYRFPTDFQKQLRTFSTLNANFNISNFLFQLKTHAWQLSPVRPSHPQMPPHLTMQPHVQGPLPPQTSSAVSLSTMGVVPQSSVVQSQAASLTSSVQQQQHQPPPQQPQNVPQSQSMLSGADEQRRRMVECERIMGPRERERERERQREREKDRELDRLRQQQQELQQRTYYATTAGVRLYSFCAIKRIWSIYISLLFEATVSSGEYSLRGMK